MKSKQQILTIKKDNGWITKIQYRKSMNDLIFKQYNKKMNHYRIIYFFDKEKDVVGELQNFLNNLKKGEYK